MNDSKQLWIHLHTSTLNEARVKQRVSEGGHSVPVKKIHSRIPRTMKHKTALTLVDEARVLDNSLKDDPFRQIVMLKSGNYKELVSPLPAWVKELLPIFHFALQVNVSVPM